MWTYETNMSVITLKRQSLRDFEDKMKYINIWVTAVPKKEKRKKHIKYLNKYQNVPKLEEKYVQIQNAHWTQIMYT